MRGAAFALLVAERKLDDRYDKALQVLEENPLRSQLFPMNGFLWHAAFALISDAQGLRDNAAKSAAKALEFADVTDSGFRYHPGVGLVGSHYGDLKIKLRQIATPSPSLIGKIKNFVSNRLPKQ